MTIDQAIKILTEMNNIVINYKSPNRRAALTIALIILIAFNNTLKEVSK